MATTRAQLRKPVTSKRKPWVTRPAIARSVAKIKQRVITSSRDFVSWWKVQPDHLRLAFVVVGLVVAVSVLNLTAAGIGRLGTSQPAAASNAKTAPAVRFLASESAPSDPGKAWVATQLWQGSNSRVTESFTVGAHWRVDWLYNPPQSGGILQVFIYSADGALLTDMAANTQKAGADSSFWAGPGTYVLKVNSTGGDWKLDVQDLR
jgi:hypothetical protein